MFNLPLTIRFNNLYFSKATLLIIKWQKIINIIPKYHEIINLYKLHLNFYFHYSFT